LVGRFDKYLHQIGRETTTRCHHCDEGVNSAQHTLEYCPAWAVLRSILTEEIGADFLPPAVLKALLTSDSGRSAVASFYERVMLRKEVRQEAGKNEALLVQDRRDGKLPGWEAKQI
jgi:hypothetical protein